MKAIVYDRYGGPERLELRELPDPSPRAGELRLRVDTVGLNALDWRFLRADPWFLRFFEGGLRRPARPTPGVDIAGHVDAVGEAVEGFAVGDPVLAWHKAGMAEFCCVPAKQAIRAPAGASLEALATLPVAGCTALQAVREHGRLQPGQRVLVNGASGGVGHFAVQIARQLGGRVTAVCSARNQALVRELGAHDSIDYAQEDFARRGEAYDLVVDCVGNRPARELRHALGPRGRLVVVGMDTSGWHGGLGGMLAMFVQSLFVPQAMLSFTAKETPEAVGELAAWVADGTLRPHIEHSYTLGEARDALAHLEGGHVRGKLVVRPG